MDTFLIYFMEPNMLYNNKISCFYEGGWPPGAPPPQQPGVAPGSTQFLPQQPASSQSFASAPGTPGAPVYQYATAPSGQQPPQPNGQGLPQVAAVGQPAPSSYGYTATTYAAPNVALPQNASINARQYQEFGGSFIIN